MLSLGWRNSCSSGQWIVLQTENEKFIGGLDEFAREKHNSVTGSEGVFARKFISIALPPPYSHTSQAKRFPQSQSLPRDESKRERKKKIVFQSKTKPAKSAMTQLGRQTK